LPHDKAARRAPHLHDLGFAPHLRVAIVGEQYVFLEELAKSLGVLRLERRDELADEIFGTDVRPLARPPVTRATLSLSVIFIALISMFSVRPIVMDILVHIGAKKVPHYFTPRRAACVIGGSVGSNGVR
jgi:hypothetical protein